MIELLVVMAILGTLIALLLPAVQSARESARRIQCQNQLRQLLVANHNYHDSHQRFPVGSYVAGPSFRMQSGWGWGSMILPQLEQSPLYNQLNFSIGTAVGPNLAAIAQHLTIWQCPSETAPSRIVVFPWNHPQCELGSGNYAGVGGIFTEMVHVKIEDILDGTSNTLMIGERQVQPGLNNSLPFTSAWCGQMAFEDGYEYRSVPHLPTSKSHPINNSPQDSLAFGSKHPGGSNFVFADGSLRFLSQSIDSFVYEALGTSKGGETVQSF